MIEDGSASTRDDLTAEEYVAAPAAPVRGGNDGSKDPRLAATTGRHDRLKPIVDVQAIQCAVAHGRIPTGLLLSTNIGYQDGALGTAPYRMLIPLPEHLGIVGKFSPAHDFGNYVTRVVHLHVYRAQLFEIGIGGNRGHVWVGS